MVRAIAVSCVTAFAIALCGCGVDESATAPSETASDPSTTASSESDLITPATGCSVVDFCNAPGSDGTTCHQQGCSLASAKNECTTESKRFCTTPLNPWVFISRSGQRFVHGACGFALSCGGHCCGLNDIVCGVNGACCDGTCKPGCPC
jgi:hypothetical protein